MKFTITIGARDNYPVYHSGYSTIAMDEQIYPPFTIESKNVIAFDAKWRMLKHITKWGGTAIKIINPKHCKQLSDLMEIMK